MDWIQTIYLHWSMTFRVHSNTVYKKRRDLKPWLQFATIFGTSQSGNLLVTWWRTNTKWAQDALASSHSRLKTRTQHDKCHTWHCVMVIFKYWKYSRKKVGDMSRTWRSWIHPVHPVKLQRLFGPKIQCFRIPVIQFQYFRNKISWNYLNYANEFDVTRILKNFVAIISLNLIFRKSSMWLAELPCFQFFSQLVQYLKFSLTLNSCQMETSGTDATRPEMLKHWGERNGWQQAIELVLPRELGRRVTYRTEGMLAAKLTETTADGHRTSEAVKDGSTGRVVAPRAERHDDGCGVVLRWILHGLVSERTGCLSRILGSVDHVANLLIWHDAVDAICRQDEERIPAVIDLPKNKKINLTKLI